MLLRALTKLTATQLDLCQCRFVRCSVFLVFFAITFLVTMGMFYRLVRTVLQRGCVAMQHFDEPANRGCCCACRAS